jgi:hypothetical protein
VYTDYYDWWFIAVEKPEGTFYGGPYRGETACEQALAREGECR